jgi:hypothetical protein
MRSLVYLGLVLALATGSIAHAATSRLCSDAIVSGIEAEAATTRACSDPCLQAARAERHDCDSSASGVFLDTVTGCLKRDHECVDSCRTERQDCRDATSLGADLARCQLDLDAATGQCRTSFPLRPLRLAICVGRARLTGFRCRVAAFAGLHSELKACRTQFSTCADACRPGSPPGGVHQCRAEGRAALRDALDECKLAYRASASACIDRDLGCVDSCIQSREGCNAPATAALNAAIAACAATRTTAVSACMTANPDGGAALEECIQAAQAAAYECRQAAIDASLPSFASCTATYAGCLRACPPA